MVRAAVDIGAAGPERARRAGLIAQDSEVGAVGTASYESHTYPGSGARAGSGVLGAQDFLGPGSIACMFMSLLISSSVFPVSF